MGGAQRDDTQCLRDMIDAIREMMGLAPLYCEDRTVSRYVSRQMEVCMGDGNRRK